VRRRIVLALALAVAAQAGPPEEVKDAISALRNRDPGDRAYAARRLASYGPVAEPAVPYLVKTLDDDDYNVRYWVERALRSIGGAAVPGLIKGLRDRDPDVRTTLCRLLAREEVQRNVVPHIDDLTDVLGDRDAGVRDAAVKLFSSLGSFAVEALLGELKDSHDETRAAATAALVAAGRKSVKRLGEALAESRNAHVREGVCIALGRMGKDGALAAAQLVAALADKKVEVQAEAARAIGRTGSAYADAQAALFNGLRDEDERLREGCIDGLAAYGAEAASDLVARLALPFAAERRGSIEALARMHKAPTDQLVEGLEGESVRQRLGVIELLVRFGWRVSNRETLPGLFECLKAKELDVRVAAADAMGRVVSSQVVKSDGSQPAAVSALVKAAADKDWRVREAALTSLGRLGSPDARAVVEKGGADEDGRVRVAAQYALWGIGGDPKPVFEALGKALADPDACVAAAAALGRMRIAAEPCVPALVEMLDHEQPAHRRAAAAALGRIVRPGRADIVELRGEWRKKAPRDVRDAIEAGLGWFGESQDDKSGGWISAQWGGGELYTPGTTGLALWTLMAAGETDTKRVQRGLDFLMGLQRRDGILGSTGSHGFLSYHAIAGTALAEAWLLTRNPRYLRALDAAAGLAMAAQNPGWAWRYEIRGGENDTHITGEMVTLLRMAELGGITVGPEVYAGATNWLNYMTDPNFGQVGYNYPGGACARPEGKQEAYPPDKSQAMTALALWCRHLIGGEALDDKICKKSVGLCEELAPTTDIPSRDQFYFHFASLAVFQQDRGGWTKWNKALEKTYVDLQEENGSWSPNGVWGADGGRVYSTAMAMLALLTPYRYPRDFASDPHLSPTERDVVSALKKATHDDDATVAAAAELAMRRITRE
jgi:HEAT repeat protein